MAIDRILRERISPASDLQPGLDVFKPALATPVPFGREVDDVARGNHRTRLEDEHMPGPHLVALAADRVCLEVLGKRTLELKCDPAPHHTDAVDGIDQGLRRLGEDVASLERDPRHHSSLSSTTLDGFRQAACARRLRGRLQSGSRPAVTVHRVQLAQVRSILEVAGTGIRERERPAEILLLPPGNGCPQVRLQMNDGILPASVGQLWKGTIATLATLPRPGGPLIDVTTVAAHRRRRPLPIGRVARLPADSSSRPPRQLRSRGPDVFQEAPAP